MQTSKRLPSCALQISVMTVKAEVSEADITRLKEQMEVYFKTLGREKKWFSKLRKVEPTPTITNNVVLYNALFDVDNKKEELMSEMTAQVFFVLAKADDVLLLPLVAVLRENPRAKKGSVEILLEDGSKEVREVTLGVSNRVMVAIRSGLSEGDKVVIPQKKQNKQERMRMPRMM